MRIGYSRVSTQEQTLEAQAERLRADGCDIIYTDHAVSGGTKGADRKGFSQAIASLGEGDTLVAVRLDRLGRSLSDLIETVRLVERRGANLRTLDGSIDTTTPTGRLTFHIFGAIAEFERELIRERTRDGMAAARVRGSKIGRRPQLAPGQVDEARELLASGLNQTQVARMLDVSRRTLARALASAAA